ncbi:MAG: DoxX family protein [Acidobacteria bacterium]|nr:DoxX family protein [Acidobacteriota bacterium]
MSRVEYLAAMVRIVIGWHFLYEGLVKLMYPGWTSAGYLKGSVGPFSSLFQWLGAQTSLMPVVDFLNIWGLIAVGLGLMLGVLTRTAAAGGVVMLLTYYLSYPPLFAPVGGGNGDGHFLLVNRNLIEIFALVLVASLPSTRFGLDALARLRSGVAAGAANLAGASRREVLAALAGVPVLGAFVWSVFRKHGYRSFEEMNLTRRTVEGNKATAGATIRSFSFTSVRDLKGRLPMGQIKGLPFSRMILGGNLIGGWAHARDLIYVSKLVKAYHHREKIFETFAIAEQCGVNAILTNPLLCDTINDYWRNGGKIKFISDCGGKDVLAMIQRSIDRGAAACYIQGAVADELVAKGRFDTIAAGLDLIRKNGLPAGIGGHKLATIQGCVDKGLRPDFWMKTLHTCNYWSAQPKDEHDNIWCTDPAETAAYMRGLKEPWIAFKVLAAGALKPEAGFRYAFEQGADFICVGMYDFQVVDDVNIALSVLNGNLVRQREWFS